MKMRVSIILFVLQAIGQSVVAATTSITSVAAQQSNRSNGSVDITVTMQGPSNDVARAVCTFVATNSETKAAIPISLIRQDGDVTGSGTTWTRKFIWDAKADAGEVKIDDVALTTVVEFPLGGVQLWEGGPYWAECNVGATKPEECGYYFWWGDTVGYKPNNGWISVKDSTSYSFSDCPTFKKDNFQLQSEGYIDATGNLVAAYDAAAAHLGSSWRMPTEAEFFALINNCDTESTSLNGVSGQLVKGRGAYASKSIFLPAAGYGEGSARKNPGGLYWSSSPHSGNYRLAYYLNFDFSDDLQVRNNDYRYYGMTVRPVRGFAEVSPMVAGMTTHLAFDFSSVDVVLVKSIAAQCSSNGFVDITVTFQAPGKDVADAEFVFFATNGSTKAAIPVVHITQNGDPEGEGTVWTRKFVWDAKADAGAVKIDDVVLTVDLKPLGGVQLWENGPYWAECNVGATKPEEFGYYFWWGDTVGYKRNANNDGWVSVEDGISFSFESGNCPTCGKSSSELQAVGYIDARENLVSAHDAATAHCGAPWRLPTDADFLALINNCTTMWTKCNGVDGCLVMGKGGYSSKSIFLPAAGHASGSALSNLGIGGELWSSTRYPGHSNVAFSMDFYYPDNLSRNGYLRESGKSVRPIREAGGWGDAGRGVSAHLALDCTLTDKVTVARVTAQQRNPWSGLVDIVVTIHGESNDVAEAECAFVATNTATQSAISVRHITRNGDDTGSGNVWTRKYIWDARADVGAVKVDDVALSVDAFVGVQLWKNGPYWATCNVGAMKREECGYYFWWGDTVGHKRNVNNDGWISAKDSTSFSFSSENCPTQGKSNLDLLTEGCIDETGNLVATYDAATEHLGTPWRMPTDAEFSALISNCDMEWTSCNGVTGRLVTGKGDCASKSIFLPAVGNGIDSGLYSLGSNGGYWSSTPILDSSDSSWDLRFYSSDFYRDYYIRSYGQAVRPVRAANATALNGGVMTHLSIDCRIVTGVTARQRYPWVGLVDVTVTLQGEADDLRFTECSFVATNSVTQTAIPLEHITRNGEDSGSGNVWTRKYVWDARADVGTVKIDDLALTVASKPMGVQLWENGPYWAECNVGAAKPEEHGYYFWWGDTVGYKREGSRWDAVDGSSMGFSFNGDDCPTYGKDEFQLESEGYIDSTGNLVAAHDAATAHLGAHWRMPTEAEFSALISNCDTEWVSCNGVYGRLVKGRGSYATKSIFMAAAGVGLGTRLDDLGSLGHYWSSSVEGPLFTYNAFRLSFHSGYFNQYFDSRSNGQPVRPVRAANVSPLSSGVMAHLAIDCRIITGVTARQRYPWNGLVDVTVTLQGTADDLLVTECAFSAMNGATKATIPVEHITRNGEDSGVENAWTRKYIWDAKADVGAVKIDDVAFTVDLKPLGVQLWEDGPYWAECNVGATKPEECGYYFWWGDTVGYKRNASNNGWVSVKDGTVFSFSSGNCPTYGKNNSQLQSEEYIDATGNLVATHDAATAHLGRGWRMPKDAEFSALINNCDTEWTSRNGVSGRLVKGRGAYASKSIFLPTAGYGYDSDLFSLGSSGLYWSSTPYSDSSYGAWYLYFNSGNFDRFNCTRLYGQPVRPLRGFAGLVGGAFPEAMTHLSLDCRAGTKVADSDHSLVYDATWYMGGVTAKITANGQKIVSGVVGTYAWTPSTDCINMLTLYVYNDSDEVVGTECVWCLGHEDLTELVIPEGTTEIGEYAFAGGQFTSVTIPNSVTNVAPTAFAGCENIKAAIIGGNFLCTSSGKIADGAWGARAIDPLLWVPTSGNVIRGVEPEFNGWRHSEGQLTDRDPLSRLSNGAVEMAGQYFSDTIGIAEGEITWELPAPSDLTKLRINTHWPDGGRSGANIESVEIKSAEDGTWLALENSKFSYGVTYDGRDDGTGADLEFVFENSEKTIFAKNVSSIRFSLGAQDNYGTGFTEFEVVADTGKCDLSVSSVFPDSFEQLESLEITGGLVSVGQALLKGCESLRRLVLPQSVRRIDAGAFVDCVALESVVFPSELEDFGLDAIPEAQRQGMGLRYDADGFMIWNGWLLDYENREASEVTVPEGVIGIGHWALADLYDLETVCLPSTLKYIASGAFARDSYLDEVEIPDSVVRIGDGAFEDCSWMQAISIGRGVECVGSRAFAGCTKLARIRFEDGLTEIGDCAFSNCWRMMSVSLPLSVTNVATTAFKDCSSLTGVNVPTGIAPLSQWFAHVYRQIKDVTIPSGETLVCSNMFKGCSALVSVDIPEGVTNIGGSAFEDCVNLPSVELPSSLQSVGESTFRNCDALTAIGLPDAVRSVGAYAFYDCSRLKDVSLSKNLESLPDYVFDACPQLDSIYVPASVTQLGSRIFSGAMSAVYFIGNAPAYDADVYASTGYGLVTYVKYGTKGWDGRPNSRDLPQMWPTGNSYGRSIMTWDPVQFDVTFDAGEGVFHPVEAQTYACEQVMYTAYSLPPFNPVRKGYKFAGWWTEAIGGAEVTPSTGVKSDRPHTLYAHWDESFIVTVRFNACGGTVLPNEIEYTAEVPFGTLPVPTREHYIFTGWYTAASGGSIVRVSTEVPKADRELFAHWSPAHYEIRFNANNGTGATATQGFIYGQDVTLRANGFSCSGCEFVGWSLTPGGEAVYTDGKTISGLAAIEDGVIDLYAVWTGNVYAVRFDSHGGLGVMPNQTFVLGVSQKLSHCTFTRSGYVFKGWALSTTAEVSYGDGEEVCNLTASKNATVVLFAVWERDPQGDWTVEEYLNCTNLTFTLGGDMPLWYGEKVARADKVGMMRSGAIGDMQTNWLQTVVSGSGTIGFWWKASGEFEKSKKGVITRYDYAEFTVDGASVEEIGDESAWTYVTVPVEGAGSHVLRWMYHKDESGSDGDDCAWLSEVSWEPMQVAEPIPELPENPTAEDVQSALAGSADSALLANVTDAATYNAYREWALKIGAADVKASPFAWASFATDSAALLAKMPTDDDLKVEEFKPSATAGSFDFTVSVKDVTIGDKASVDNLKKLFGLEGAESLDTAVFSSENVSLDFKEPQDGKLRFTATPAVDNAKSFFMKVKVK